MGEQILDFSHIVDHDTVKLPGGRVREIINPGDLGITEYQQLAHLQQQVGALSDGKLTAAKEKELLRLLGEAVKILIPDITAVELSKLSRAHREQTLWAWISRHMPTGESAEGEARSRRTGGGSSRGSRRSTAATRQRGSRRRSGS